MRFDTVFPNLLIAARTRTLSLILLFSCSKLLQRAKLKTATQMTPALFMEWKRKKIAERDAGLAASQAERAKNDRMRLINPPFISFCFLVSVSLKLIHCVRSQWSGAVSVQCKLVCGRCWGFWRIPEGKRRGRDWTEGELTLSIYIYHLKQTKSC